MHLVHLAGAVRGVVASMRVGRPESIVVPVASTALSAFTNDVFMDNDRLPPIRQFTLATGEAVNGHDLGSEFVYICMGQVWHGSFSLVGESGLFSVGFSSLEVACPTCPEPPEAPPDMTLTVTRPDFTGYSAVLRGCEQKGFFLAKGDAFRLTCTLPPGAETHHLDGAETSLVITRLSENAGFTHHAPAQPGAG